MDPDVSKELSYLEAIREALAEEMRRDPKVFVLGEDVGAYGGAFGVTQGLYDEFGEKRVVDTPISESAIIGISIGAALRGYRPVAEMQFADFISCGFDQIVNQAATLRYRYGGRRVGADRRSRAVGRQRRRRPVSLAESRGLVRAPAGAEGGGAVDAVRREGTAQGGDSRRQPGRSTSSTSICIAARRAPCPKATRSCRSAWRRRGAKGTTSRSSPTARWSTPSLEAADRLAKEGVEVEVIDLRTLLPFDKAADLRVRSRKPVAR